MAQMAKAAGGTLAHGGTYGHGQSSSGMPQLKAEDFAPQLIWLALTFTMLYIIMSKLALPRIGHVIEERRNRIATDLDKAEEYKAMTEQAIAGYEQALAEARAKAHAIGQETREATNAEVERERRGMEEKLAAMTAEAEARIRASKEAALAQVNVVAGATAEEIVSTLIGAKVSEAERNAAVTGSLPS